MEKYFMFFQDDFADVEKNLSKGCVAFLFDLNHWSLKPTNICAMTEKELADKCECSLSTVFRLINELQRNDIVRKAGMSKWMINPKYISWTEDKKLYDSICETYENLKLYTPNKKHVA